MAFPQIPTIYKYSNYIDVAFRRGTKFKDEKKKIEAVRDELVKKLEKVLHTFPEFESLAPFYQELFDAHIETGNVKKALASLLWASQKIKLFSMQYIRKTRSNGASINEYYGRINSLLKQINSNLELLEVSRKLLRKFPTVKTAMETYCIVGFPNVGKTTLLKKLTYSRAEVNEYAFTTKGINIGYTKAVQLLDTPGTLNRPEIMNVIEHTAYLAMKYLADKIIYVFDPTEISYPLKDQLALYKRVKEYKKPMVVYISKLDIITDFPKELLDLNPIDFEAIKELCDKKDYLSLTDLKKVCKESKNNSDI